MSTNYSPTDEERTLVQCRLPGGVYDTMPLGSIPWNLVGGRPNTKSKVLWATPAPKGKDLQKVFVSWTSGTGVADLWYQGTKPKEPTKPKERLAPSHFPDSLRSGLRSSDPKKAGQGKSIERSLVPMWTGGSALDVQITGDWSRAYKTVLSIQLSDRPGESSELQHYACKNRTIVLTNGNPARGIWPSYDGDLTSAVQKNLEGFGYHPNVPEVDGFMGDLWQWNPEVAENHTDVNERVITVFKNGVRMTAKVSLCVSVASWDERESLPLLTQRVAPA